MKKRISDAKFTIGLSIVAFLFLIMLSSFFYLPYNPNEVSIKEKFLFFSARHILGTDGLGRDVFCRVLISLRVSFFIGFSAATFGFLTGTLLGSFGGFFGGKTDAVITKIIDYDAETMETYGSHIFYYLFDSRGEEIFCQELNPEMEHEKPYLYTGLCPFFDGRVE